MFTVGAPFLMTSEQVITVRRTVQSVIIIESQTYDDLYTGLSLSWILYRIAAHAQ